MLTKYASEKFSLKSTNKNKYGDVSTKATKEILGRIILKKKIIRTVEGVEIKSIATILTNTNVLDMDKIILDEKEHNIAVIEKKDLNGNIIFYEICVEE